MRGRGLLLTCVLFAGCPDPDGGEVTDDADEVFAHDCGALDSGAEDAHAPEDPAMDSGAPLFRMPEPKEPNFGSVGYLDMFWWRAGDAGADAGADAGDAG